MKHNDHSCPLCVDRFRLTRAAHKILPFLHDWVDRPFRSVAPGPREVTGLRGICRRCGAQRFAEDE